MKRSHLCTVMCPMRFFSPQLLSEAKCRSHVTLGRKREVKTCKKFSRIFIAAPAFTESAVLNI